jgi:hypothetical protein
LQSRPEVNATDGDLTVGDDAVDEAEDPRRVAHELLGQSEAVLHLAARHDVIGHWCTDDLQPAVLSSHAELAKVFGAAHAEIGSGAFDAELLESGIGGTLGLPKRRGLRVSLERLYRSTRRNRGVEVRKWLRASVGWASSALGSMGLIPGADVIRESLEGVVAGLDTFEAARAENHSESTLDVADATNEAINSANIAADNAVAAAREARAAARRVSATAKKTVAANKQASRPD